MTFSLFFYTIVHVEITQKQLKLLKTGPLSYGGELLKTRNGRLGPRPLDTKNTMHLVLRSSKAKGAWSFRRPDNQRKIKSIMAKFSAKYHVHILSMANVGNHLHLQIQLYKRQFYKPFIRAVTSAIAMAVTGMNRWSKNGLRGSKTNEVSAIISRREHSSPKLKFWDYRPFTRVVKGFKAFLKLKDYIAINKLEGFGVQRNQARFILQGEGLAFAESFAKGSRAGP